MWRTCELRGVRIYAAGAEKPYDLIPAAGDTHRFCVMEASKPSETTKRERKLRLALSFWRENEIQPKNGRWDVAELEKSK